MPRKIRLVTASRADARGFAQSSALGRSLALLGAVREVELRLFPENRAGLPVVYNTAIAEAERDPAILVFAHDDIAICDFHWVAAAEAALARFDIVGPVGNSRREPGQTYWYAIDPALEGPESGCRSGAIAHGAAFPAAEIAHFGPPGLPCRLLDGVMLIADSATLIARDLRFDPRFRFHFYDMDFCRQAELRNLRLGTAPISLVHESRGNFDGAHWQAACRAYLEKYGESAAP